MFENKLYLIKHLLTTRRKQKEANLSKFKLIDKLFLYIYSKNYSNKNFLTSFKHEKHIKTSKLLTFAFA